MILGSPLTPLEDILRNILEWLHGTIGLPWAWAIVAITIMVRLLMVPLAIYVGSQLASTYFMSTTMDKTQRTMMMVLPIAFVPVLVNFPVGLVIYWVTTNLWTVGQGLVTRRLVPKKPPAPPKRSSRTPPKTEAPSQDGAVEAPAPEPAAPSQPRRVKRKKKRARR